MVQIAPFRGILYNRKKIRDLSKVIAPPYDVIAPEEQERLHRKSPYNVVRLILNQEPDPYESVARLLAGWRGGGGGAPPPGPPPPPLFPLLHHPTKKKR